MVRKMKISVLCETIQATQTISFCFNQSDVPQDKRVDLKLQSWSDLKRLNPTTRYQILYDCDYLILSRWYNPNDFLKIIFEARKNEKKIFLHLDDFLFDVPKSIGIEKWLHYSSTNMLDALYSTAKLSDGIIASTSRLANEIKNILPQIPVLTSPYYKHFDLDQCTASIASERVYPVIGYMGTQSHADDLEILTVDIDKLMHRNPLTVFETFGIEVPQLLLDKYPHRCFTLDKVNNYQEFQSTLSSRGWWVGLAPLTETKFNFCKANTKFLEYIQAGIPVIASNFGPYENIPTIDAVFNDSPQYSWLSSIESLLFSRINRITLFEKQLQFCKQFSDPLQLVEFYRSVLN